MNLVIVQIKRWNHFNQLIFFKYPSDEESPKYKLNDSNVKYLLMKDPSNEPGNSPNKKMEPF